MCADIRILILIQNITKLKNQKFDNESIYNTKLGRDVSVLIKVAGRLMGWLLKNGVCEERLKKKLRTTKNVMLVEAV